MYAKAMDQSFLPLAVRLWCQLEDTTKINIGSAVPRFSFLIFATESS
jgi:hypothetical protein